MSKHSLILIILLFFYKKVKSLTKGFFLVTISMGPEAEHSLNGFFGVYPSGPFIFVFKNFRIKIMQEKITLPENLKHKIKVNFNLKEISFVKIGGITKYFIEITNKKDLISVLKWVKKNNLEIFIIGNASNILFDDGFYPGVIIKINNRRFIRGKNEIIVSAGMLINDFLKKCEKYQIKDYEWLAGIPGTIGGAVYGNAGAYSRAIGEKVIKVKTINIDTFKEKIYLNSDCLFGYRESIFKRNNLKEIIWEVVLKKVKGSKSEIKKKIREYLQERVLKKNYLYPSLGCVFKNILFNDLKNNKRAYKIIQKLNPSIKEGKISVGWLIEKCNLKIKKIDGVMISPYHHNIIVNIGKGSFKSFLKLMNLIKKEIFKKFYIEPEEEIIIKKF